MIPLLTSICFVRQNRSQRHRSPELLSSRLQITCRSPTVPDACALPSRSFGHVFVACDADDSFRTNFLWGRKPMLAACAVRLEEQRELVWVDLGGGTGVRTPDRRPAAEKGQHKPNSCLKVYPYKSCGSHSRLVAPVIGIMKGRTWVTKAGLQIGRISCNIVCQAALCNHMWPRIGQGHCDGQCLPWLTPDPVELYSPVQCMFGFEKLHPLPFDTKLISTAQGVHCKS